MREAVVSVRHMGASRSVMDDKDVRDGIDEGGSVGLGDAAAIVSLAEAIRVRREARRGNSSEGGYE